VLHKWDSYRNLNRGNDSEFVASGDIAVTSLLCKNWLLKLVEMFVVQYGHIIGLQYIQIIPSRFIVSNVRVSMTTGFNFLQQIPSFVSLGGLYCDREVLLRIVINRCMMVGESVVLPISYGYL